MKAPVSDGAKGDRMKYRYSTRELEEMERCRWLTERERKVFELFYRRGWAIEDIAAELYLSRRTIDSTLASIREKSCG